MESKEFANKLITWYLQNKRDLPWRNTTNPYHIWLSEIILQQTKISQGLPYYLRFVEHFPTIHDLANASEEQVLKLWQGLGYYSRARNLHHTAQIIHQKYQGNFPNNYNDLLQLKGIGPYTAAAIASFAFKEAVPVVDGNVFRVLSRYLGIKTDIANSKALKEFTSVAKELIDPKQPDLFNQAMMEFGSEHCSVHQPKCENCIFNTSCWALANQKVNVLPIKIKKLKTKKRHFLYLVLQDLQGNVALFKRDKSDIWAGMYEFLLVEKDTPWEIEHLTSQINSFEWSKKVQDLQWTEPMVKHKLTHQYLEVRFAKVLLNSAIDGMFRLEEANQLPMPKIIHDFMQKLL
jgi:A/G-specific adenine glycosylase